MHSVTHEDLFKAFDFSKVGMALVSCKQEDFGRFIYVNPALCKFLERDKESLKKTNFQSITHPDFLEEDLKQAKRLFNDELKSYSMEKKYVMPDGSYKWALLNGTLSRDENNFPKFFIAQIIDINEQKNISKELRMAAELGEIGIWSYHVDSNKLSWNDEMFRLFNINKDQLSVEDFYKCVVSDDRERVQKSVEDSIEKGVFYDEEYSVLVRGGKRRIKATGSYSKAEKIMAGVCIDITEKHSLCENLEASNRALEHFAYAASHDLRTPLRTTKNFIEILVDSFQHTRDLNIEEKRFLKLIFSSIESMRDLITSLLNYSRINTKESVLVQANLRKLAECSLSSSFSEEELQYVELIGEGANIECLESLVKSIIQNLVQNGLKFYKKGQKPRVEVIFSECGNSAEISVKDYGVGIPQDKLEDVKKPFSRIHDKADYEGSGLGLSICDRIAEKHGGQLIVESSHGHWTKVTFRIPKHV